VGKMPGSLEEKFSDQSGRGVSVKAHRGHVNCRQELFIGRKRIGTQRIAAKGVDIDEDFRSVRDESPNPGIERGLIAVLWEGEPGEIERSCRRSLRPTLRYAIRWRSGESACGPSGRPSKSAHDRQVGRLFTNYFSLQPPVEARPGSPGNSSRRNG
jgi:hypothetical protein